MTPNPTVSVVLPALNERRFIYDCLASLLAQDYEAIVEILVVDGGSTDGTREIVESLGPRVSLVDNPDVTAGAALNRGIEIAVGEVLVRADAHATYSPDYVRECIATMQETGAHNVGGRMTPVGTTPFGRAVAAVTSSRIGVGPGRFHYADARVETDTVYLGCWRRETLVDLGGFDQTSLQWGAEDHELNHRLRRAGGRIVLDPSIQSTYFPREDPSSLWRQYHNYGIGKASTLAKHRELPSWRPLGPAGLVAGSALELATRHRLALPMLHAGAMVVAAWRMRRSPGVSPWRAFTVLMICHWSYGLGFWRGVLRAIRRQPFDSSPRGHR